MQAELSSAHAMYVGNGREGGYAYYWCTNRTSFRGVEEEKCRGKTIRAQELEDVVWSDIKEFVRNPGKVMEQLEARLKAEIKRDTKTDEEFADTAEAISKKQKERERILGLYRRGIIGDDEVEQQLRDLQQEIVNLEDEQQRIFGKRDAFTQLRTRTINAEILLKSLRKKLSHADEYTKRDLIEALVDHIVVDTKGEGDARQAEVTIHYLFDKPKKPPPGGGGYTDYYRRSSSRR